MRSLKILIYFYDKSIEAQKNSPSSLVFLSNLQGRAFSKYEDQGQWLNDQDWLQLEKLIPKYYGNYTIKFKRPIYNNPFVTRSEYNINK